jgi:cytochrome c-type biogenesis protein CcmH/NrfG
MVVTGSTEAAESEAQPLANMVDRLAARLEVSPNDEAGWIMLMKSRTILGQSDLARDALRKSLAAFATDPGVQKRLSGAAINFGLKAD